MEFKTMRLKADEARSGEFTGYASTWTRTPDSWGDVVTKGAFTDTLADWEEKGLPIPCLWGHRMDDPSHFIGAVTEATEDDHGLFVRVALDLDNPKAEHVHRLLKSGLVAQMSFAFDIVDSGTVDIDGVKARELRAVRLYEVSVVPIGANQDTSIEDVKAPNSDNTDDGDGDGGEEPLFTDAQVKALRAIADEWIADHDDPQEGDSDSNDDGDETGQEGGKSARAEAVARLNQELNALIGGQKGEGA